MRDDTFFVLVLCVNLLLFFVTVLIPKRQAPGQLLDEYFHSQPPSPRQVPIVLDHQLGTGGVKVLVESKQKKLSRTGLLLTLFSFIPSLFQFNYSNRAGFPPPEIEPEVSQLPIRATTTSQIGSRLRIGI